MATALANDSRPEDSVATDDRIRADLGRLLQNRLVHESGLAVFAHPILIGVITGLAWPDSPHELLLGRVAAGSVGALVRGPWLFRATPRQPSARPVPNRAP